MKSVLLDIPDDSQLWPNWLEEQLIGRHLGDLVDQLQLIIPESDSQQTLESLCGPELNSVLASGLSALSEQQLHQLLKSPKLLLELQEKVFTDGLEYWKTVPITDEHQQQVKVGWSRLGEHLNKNAPNEPKTPLKQQTTKPRRIQARLLGTIAASLLVGFLFWLSSPGPSGTSDWGFNRPGALAAEIPEEEYFNELADAAGEWFNERPETNGALATRLQQFSDGCQTLIDARHSQLSDEDRAWLIERCGVWKGQIDTQLAELNSGQKPFEQVRTKADETVKKLSTALKERSQQA